jgi:hypothetical protein
MLPPQKCGMPSVGQSLIQAILSWAIFKPNIPPPMKNLPGMGQVKAKHMPSVGFTLFGGPFLGRVWTEPGMP